MKTTSLGQIVATLRVAFVVALFFVGPAARLACAVPPDSSDAPKDPKDPRFQAVPAGVLPSTSVVVTSSVSSGASDTKDPRFQAVPPEVLQPAVPAATKRVSPPAPAAVIPKQAPTISQAAELPAAVAPAPLPPVSIPQPIPIAPALSPQDASINAHTQGQTLYSFHADQLDLQTALAMFARNNGLNIVPDNDVLGTVTLDLRDLPLQQVMRALLEAADCTWHEESGLIRVRNTETRTFAVDYLRLSRKGIGQSSALMASGSSGGQGGSTGGGGQSGGAGGSQGATGYGSSSVNLTADNPIDFWKELKIELASMLTTGPRQTITINMTAGLVQVTDRPSALKNVEHYLSGVDKSIHRQVDIETRLYSVTLNNQFQFGIDWAHVATAYGGTLGFGGSTLPVANSGSQLADSVLGGISTLPNVGTTPQLGNNVSTLVFQNFNTKAAINALELQGKVEVISKPRVRTLNNQTALIKVGEDLPFFNNSGLVQQSSGGFVSQQNITVTSITVGTILSLTPQISEDDWISLDISPVLTSLKGVVSAPSSGGSGGGGSGGGTTAPDLETKQASALVRVRDGTTVVMGGLIQTQVAKNLTKIPLLGDIPLLGKLFTGTFDSKLKQELVIFVTPHIVRDFEGSAKVPSEEGANAIRLIAPR
jgi:MSHA type pilus biogenesis protein MshL